MDEGFCKTKKIIASSRSCFFFAESLKDKNLFPFFSGKSVVVVVAQPFPAKRFSANWQFDLLKLYFQIDEKALK